MNMIERIEPRFEISKTRRVYTTLRDRISNGELTPGTKLPSEPELAELHGVSRVTIRRALAELEREGVISRRPGAGTYVTAYTSDSPLVADLTRSLSHLSEVARTTHVEVVEFGYAPPTSDLSVLLKVHGDELVQRSVRVRSSSDGAIGYYLSYLPSRVGQHITEADLRTNPMLALIERAGVRIDRATQTVTAVEADDKIARHLGVLAGSALLQTTCTYFEARGRGVYHVVSYHVPSRFNYRIDLVRIDAGGERLWNNSDF